MSRRQSEQRKDLFRLREFDRKQRQLARRKARQRKSVESGRTVKIGGRL